MFGLVSLGWWAMRSPLVWLWHGYRGLWWAFADAPAQASATGGAAAPSGASGPSQDTAFQVVDSSPARATLARPDALLRIGFSASAAVCVILAGVLMSIAPHAGLTPAHATIVWVWLTLLGVVLSLFWVRHVAVKRHLSRSAWNDAKASVGRAARVGGRAAGHAAVATAGAIGRSLKSIGAAARRYHEQRKPAKQ